MLEVIVQMGVLICAGVVLKLLRPGGRDPELLRHGVTDIVYYLLLPALVLESLWRTQLSWDSLRIAGLAGTGVHMALWHSLPRVPGKRPDPWRSDVGGRVS